MNVFIGDCPFLVELPTADEAEYIAENWAEQDKLVVFPNTIGLVRFVEKISDDDLLWWSLQSNAEIERIILQRANDLVWHLRLKPLGNGIEDLPEGYQARFGAIMLGARGALVHTNWAPPLIDEKYEEPFKVIDNVVADDFFVRGLNDETRVLWEKRNGVFLSRNPVFIGNAVMFMKKNGLL